MIKRIAHVAIATRSIAVMAEFYKLIGLEIDTIETIWDQKAKVALMRVGNSALELVEPTANDSPVSRFIEKYGEGIHHVSLEVDDLAAHLRALKERNVRLVDENPRKGADGSLIAFIHPHSTGGVLIELSQPAGME